MVFFGYMQLQRLGYLLLVCSAVTLVSIPAFAAAPAEIFTFQGLLKDSSGALINGQKDITLRIYTTATGGSASDVTGTPNSRLCPSTNVAAGTTCIWQENQTGIGVSGGIFTITAGNHTSLNRINFTNALYLEVIMRAYDGSGSHSDRSNFGNDQVLTPRINLTSAPFAISAMQATGTNSTSSLFNLNQKGIFNATQLFVNQTDSSFTDTIVNITSTGVGTGFNVKAESTVNNVVNITSGSLTTGSALVIESTSGNTATRNLVNMTNDNTAATGTTVLSLRQGSTGNILNVVNASGAETLKVSGAGVTTVTQLKVNTTGTTLRGIFTGQNTTVVTLGTNTITVTNADGNDVAICSFQSGLVTPATPSKTFFVTVGNVTTNNVFVNVTYQGPGSYPRAPFPLNCLVFDITP